MSKYPVRILVVLFVAVGAVIGGMFATDAWTPKLGLDLRGGTTVTLTASTDGGGAPAGEALEEARGIIQKRVDSMGVGESEVAISGDRQIVVSVPNVDEDKLVEMVGQTAELRFRGVYAGMPVENPQAGTPGQTDEERAKDPNRQPELPLAPPAPRPTAEGEGLPPSEALGWEPSEQDIVDFQRWTCDMPAPDVSDQPLFSCDREGTTKYLLTPAILKGDQVTDASSGIPQGGVAYVVTLQFNEEGGKAFQTATGELAAKQEPQNQFAIVLDGETVSAPSVSEPIPGGQAQIEGNFNQASADDLASVLRYGALPLSFEVSSVDTVSPTLGGEQLRAGLIAGAVGLALVLLYGLFYYRGLGVIMMLSLVLAGVLTYGLMTLLGESMGFALNLPGIAGVIVSVGITADSFIIYFERIRDDIREGRSVRSAAVSGWKAAYPTLLIADAVSLISAVVLYVLAVGGVQGFAFTLGLTTLVDLVIVFAFTHPVTTLLLRTKFFGRGHRLSGLDKSRVGVNVVGGRTRRRRTAGTEA